VCGHPVRDWMSNRFWTVSPAGIYGAIAVRKESPTAVRVGREIWGTPREHSSCRDRHCGGSFVVVEGGEMVMLLWWVVVCVG
jgi:hypothetical protein